MPGTGPAPISFYGGGPTERRRRKLKAACAGAAGRAAASRRPKAYHHAGRPGWPASRGGEPPPGSARYRATKWQAVCFALQFGWNRGRYLTPIGRPEGCLVGVFFIGQASAGSAGRGAPKEAPHCQLLFVWQETPVMPPRWDAIYLCRAAVRENRQHTAEKKR